MGIMSFRRKRAEKLKKAGKDLKAYGLDDALKGDGKPSQAKKVTKKAIKKASSEEE